MSEENKSKSVCASCASAEVDEVKLVTCADCDLVKYCSIECQENHKSHHEETCSKRAAELRDELLFKQPESNHWGDCPICMLPLPLDLPKSTMMTCCSKTICNGCNHVNKIREAKASLVPSCPFCRKPVPTTKEEAEKQRMKRLEVNDPEAMRQEGLQQYKKGDYSSAFEWHTKAAELGDVTAHYSVSCMYRDGQGVKKDKGKEMYHLEEAAIGGHHDARFNLGCEEGKSDNFERAVKHWIISAKLGHDSSIKSLMDVYRGGFVSKDDLAAALRAHHAAVDATRSPQREAAEEFYRNAV